MSWLLQFVDGPHEGKYLRFYDPDAAEGVGLVMSTPDQDLAIHFGSFADAMEEWKRPSTVQPLRLDGKPNRPLSAWSVSPMKVGS